jgi:dihydropyrimidinase
VIQPGADGDVVVYDPNGHTSIGVGEGRSHHMAMDYSAWEGFEIDGHVDTVLSRGKVIVDGGDYLGAKGDGKYVKRSLSQYLV